MYKLIDTIFSFHEMFFFYFIESIYCLVAYPLTLKFEIRIRMRHEIVDGVVHLLEKSINKKI